MAEAQRLIPITRAEEEDIDLELGLFLEALYRKFRYDFRGYSRASLQRRVLQLLPGFGCRSISMLQDRLIHDPGMLSAILPLLTISTTEMFRDPEYFLAIREQVVPLLKTYPSVKVWIAGCSTGEEVYSMAILFKEEGLLDKTILYATDINPVSLRKAQEGIYSFDDMKKFTANYQRSGGKAAFSDYYTARYGSAILDPALRRNVVFSDHSLATDQVFSETQFVSCRNVLIYFERTLQDRAIGLFHESLVLGGFLGIGSKESLRFSEYSGCFRAVADEERIYQKTEAERGGG